MKCPNCNHDIIKGEQFCKNCGVKIIWKPVQTVQNNIQQNNYTQNEFKDIFEKEVEKINEVPQNIAISDNDLIDAYIGTNVKELKNEGFSFCSLFFSSLYFLYRKMWLLALLYVTIPALVQFIVSLIVMQNSFDNLVTIEENLIALFATMTSLSAIFSIINFIISIIVAVLFKKMYLKHVTKKVNNIKANNSGKSNQQLLNICRKKGGTSITAVVIVLLIPFIIGFIGSILSSHVVYN